MYLIVKRGLDIILATTLLLMLFIPMIIISIVIKIEDRGPVIYKSKRMGKGLKIFNTYRIER